MKRQDKLTYIAVALVLAWWFLTLGWYSAQVFGQTTQPSYRSMALGINVDQNAYYDEAGAWNDVTHAWSGWYNCAKYDANGYPLSNGAQCQCLMLGCPAGTYTVQFDGTATLNPNWGPALTGLTKVGVTTTAQWTLTRANQQVMFTVSGLNPSDPFRNFHIYQPGQSAKSPVFSAAWTKWLAPFTVIRAIDWPPVNLPSASPATQPTAGPVTTWANRVQPTAWDQTSRGVAWEYFLSLAKQTNTIPWINIPYDADDDYARQLATLIKSYNFPCVIPELSNEVWNSGFGQWAENWNAANVPPNMAVDGDISSGSVVPYPNGKPGTNAATRANRLYAERARHLGYIFRDVLGAGHVKMVLAGQHMNPQVLTDELQWTAAAHGDVQQSFQYIAIAPYFPLNQPSGGQTIPQIAAAIQADFATNCGPMIAAHAKLSQQYGVPLVGYEGGQSLFAWTPGNQIPTAGQNGLIPWPATDLPVAIQTDPSMGTLYTQWLNLCQTNGMSLVCHDSFIRPWQKGGLFALEQDLADNPAGPKWSAIDAFSQLPPPPAPAPPLPPPSTQPINLNVTVDPVSRTATVH